MKCRKQDLQVSTAWLMLLTAAVYEVMAKPLTGLEVERRGSTSDYVANLTQPLAERSQDRRT